MFRRQINELYLMECEGYVKIGIAFCSRDRRKLLQTGNPFEIRLLQVLPCDDPQAEESKFHHKYAQYRVRGEWFKLPKEVLNELLFDTHPEVRNSPPMKFVTTYKTGDGPPDPEYWSEMNGNSP